MAKDSKGLTLKELKEELVKSILSVPYDSDPVKRGILKPKFLKELRRRRKCLNDKII
jgi:hypothetical protein